MKDQVIESRTTKLVNALSNAHNSYQERLPSTKCFPRCKVNLAVIQPLREINVKLLSGRFLEQLL